ncbi:hypothetical protein [Glaciecola sp. KUL10]|uniref:hypothetical protein n=1 Tax=Glaciecola sp. (strain KUL10) TaxID=2161813 RepID=UPI000D787C58|nr:hypothetical protein [Glaciecola sp. KUL10]GBL05912.1 lipoprotein [Glaciecola sp. KUL10]
MYKLLVTITGFALTTGCTSTGTIQGVSGNNTVQFEYEQTLFEHQGLLKVTMPSGERFTGKYVQGSTTSSGTDWELGESSDESIILRDSTTISSKAEAVLIGDKGSTMSCWLTLSAPEVGLDGGGIGKCKTSTNKKVSFTF